MRRSLLTLAVLVLPFSMVACEDAVETVQEGVEQATEQIGETAELVEFCSAALDVAQAVNDRNYDEAIERGEVLVAEAPEEIAPAARTVVDGAKRIRDGETAVAQDPEFQQAVDELQTYTRDRCNPTN